MPKVTIDTTFPFSATPKAYTPHEFEKPVKATKVAKKTTVVAKKATKKKVK